LLEGGHCFGAEKSVRVGDDADAKISALRHESNKVMRDCG
jgi:hypothetical protein